MTFWPTADFSIATAESEDIGMYLQKIKRKLPSTPNSVKTFQG